MKSDARLKELLRLARCWDRLDEAQVREIEEERKRITPPQDLMDTMATLRREWAKAAVSQRRNRHVFFLGFVYAQVGKWRRLKRQGELLAALREHYEVPGGRDIYQSLLIVTCGDQDRRIRSRWATCLREVERRKTPSDLGAAQIIRLGGINRCARRRS